MAERQERGEESYEQVDIVSRVLKTEKGRIERRKDWRVRAWGPAHLLGSTWG